MDKNTGKLLSNKIISTLLSCLFLLGFMILFGFLTYMSAKKMFLGVHFNDADSVNDYVYIDAEYMSDSFAIEDESNTYFLFATEISKDGKMRSDYAVSFTEEQYNSKAVQDIIDYTYSEDDDAQKPEPLRIKGMIAKASSELIDLEYEYFPYYDSNATSDSDVDDYIGEYVLDNTQKPRLGFNSATLYLALMLIAAVAFLIFFIQQLLKLQKRSNKNKHAKELLESDPNYMKAIEEMKQPDTQFFKQAKLYVTANYVISYFDGLDIFPINDIRELYGYDKHKYHPVRGILFGAFAAGKNEHVLVAVLTDGTAHEFANLAYAVKQHSAIVALIVPRQTQMTLGRNSAPTDDILPYLDTLNLSQLAGFYGSDAPWSGRTNQ